MKAVISMLMEISLYSAIIAGAIVLFRALFRKSISARLQYLVWFLLIVRLILPVTFESGFYVESLFPKSVAETMISEVSAFQSGAQASGADALTAPAVARAQTDWYDVGAAVWLSGMGVFALWMGFVKLRHYRRMMAARMETPQAVTALYEACRRGLGVKRAMPIWVVNAAMSPGIALFGKPVLLMPASTLSSKEALRFALLHELMHKKRGDHIVNAVMNLLRIVYWFHPVVQYALSQMQSDMETACDSDVMRPLYAGEKKAYLITIINLFSFETQPQLGMAQFRTRRMAEQRVKGAFMKSATTIGSKIAAAVLAAILLTACFTTACQKAPEATATLLADMSDKELDKLAKRLRAKYLYNSAEYTFDENNSHYSDLFNELGIFFGGSMGGGDAEGMSFSLGLPMENFEESKCYPYAAVICALDPGVIHLDLHSMDYYETPAERRIPEPSLSVAPSDVEKHYAAVLDKPLISYTQSDALMAELLTTMIDYEK